MKESLEIGNGEFYQEYTDSSILICDYNDQKKITYKYFNSLKRPTQTLFIDKNKFDILIKQLTNKVNENADKKIELLKKFHSEKEVYLQKTIDILQESIVLLEKLLSK